MKIKKKQTHKQQLIERQQHKDDWQRLHWQKKNGLSDKHFASLPLSLVQAQMIATNILKGASRYLDHNDVAMLNNYLLAISHASKRRKLTEADAYKVMNIGKAVNRKLFKAYKAVH